MAFGMKRALVSEPGPFLFAGGYMEDKKILGVLRLQ